MKKYKNLCFSLIFVMAPVCMFAQDSLRNIVRVNPGSLLLTNISLFYERGFTPRTSLVAGVNYQNANIVNIPISGYGFTVEYRYHFKKSLTLTPQGFYAAPWGRYQHYALTLPVHFKDPVSGKDYGTATTSFSATQYAAGGIIGYGHVFKKGFSLDVFLGPYYNYTSLSLSAGYSIVNIPLLSAPLSGFWLRSGITVGQAF